jgi:formylglycine-generating enzyme required for sulfatase activity
MKKMFAIPMIMVIFFSSFQGGIRKNTATALAASTGVDITYEVTITAPPQAGIAIKATYSNITSPLRLQIGYERWPDPTLSVFKDLRFSSLDGKDLSWTKIDDRTIEVIATTDSVVANYAMNLTGTAKRPTKVSGIGGVLNGYEEFPVPGDQTINSVRVKFMLPQPWVAISAYPKQGDWFEVQPYTYADLSLETKSSAWFFGNVDFDQTKRYADGFEIRVVGFKYFGYEHWDVYLGDTPLEEALKSADFYHEAYSKIKGIYGEFPVPKLLLVGPGYWQAGNTFLNQQLVGQYRYEYIPHHLLHAFFGIEGSRIIFSGSFYSLLAEGYPTYSEGIMTADITGDPAWRGMLFERKFHYLRGMKFNNMTQNSRQYVLGFIVTYLMDQQIRSETNDQKGINDLMAQIWKKYSTPNLVRVSDEQVLETLQELTGQDWHSFYAQNVLNTDHLNVAALDDLKGDFNIFLKTISDRWYNGYPSMYFVGQEIVAAAGDFDMNVRMQDPMHITPSVADFAVAALRYMDIKHSDLTEKDVENVLSQITHKDHADFFEFYRSQGFNVDLNEINEFLKTFTYVRGGTDNAIKFTPNTFPLGQSTSVVGELVDNDFTRFTDFKLQVQVYDQPTGLTGIKDLISGKGVSYTFAQKFSTGGNLGPAGTNYIFSLPRVKIGDKTYTFFTINLPKDAGAIIYSIIARTTDKTEYGDYLGAFIGTEKVLFQTGTTFQIKPAGFNLVDNTPPVFSITQPTTSEASTDVKRYCIKGLVEPDAKVLVNGSAATINDASFDFIGCVDLLPGRNVIDVQASDKAGNTSTREIILNSPGGATPTPQMTVTLPGLTPSAPQNTPVPSLPLSKPQPPSASNSSLPIVFGIVLMAAGVGSLAMYFIWRRQPSSPPLAKKSTWLHQAVGADGLLLVVAGVLIAIRVVPGLPAAPALTVTVAPVTTGTVAATEIPSPTSAPTATETQVPTKGPIPGSSWRRPEDNMLMVYVPQGEFNIGSNGVNDLVNLNGFWIDQTEVTNGMYALCVQAGICQPPGKLSSYTRPNYYGNPQYANYPVVWVDWTAAWTYCSWAGARLPGAAEWQKAALGTDGRPWPWGYNFPNDRQANYKSTVGDTTAVGSYPAGASPYGALDMVGNVWEWVKDYIGQTDPSQVPNEGLNGIIASEDGLFLRGGSWCDDQNYIRDNFKYWCSRDWGYFAVGFRCALSSP